jgi:hypothetical protein
MQAYGGTAAEDDYDGYLGTTDFYTATDADSVRSWVTARLHQLGFTTVSWHGLGSSDDYQWASASCGRLYLEVDLTFTEPEWGAWGAYHPALQVVAESPLDQAAPSCPPGLVEP